MKSLALALALAAAPAAADPRTQLLDLSADVLAPDESEVGVFWGRYARGVYPNLQLATHFAGDVIGLVNLFAKYRFLSREELRVSAELGAAWWALLLVGSEPGNRPLLLFLPVELRATIPLAERLELDLGWLYRASLTGGGETRFGISSLRIEATLARYDSRGAWILTGRFPLLSRAEVKLDTLLGKSNVAGVLTVDDLASWGILVARDLTVLKSTHLRFGLGYRNTPGLLFYESIGKVLVNFDLYWR